MQSPFPGMDPFIESSHWRSFHLSFLARMKDALAVQLPERYVVFAEENVIANDLIIGVRNDYVPDLGITEGTGFTEGLTSLNSSTVNVTPPQIILPLLEVKQRTLTVRNARSNELVTAIELLSPTNKKGERNQYMRKRQNLLRNQVNLVEVDFLRGGKAILIPDEVVVKTYQIISTDAISRLMKFWSVGLDEPLPSISVPLLPEDDPLVLNLQSLFEREYKLSMYSRSITYDINKLKPKATKDELPLLNSILEQA